MLTRRISRYQCCRTSTLYVMIADLRCTFQFQLVFACQKSNMDGVESVSAVTKCLQTFACIHSLKFMICFARKAAGRSKESQPQGEGEQAVQDYCTGSVDCAVISTACVLNLSAWRQGKRTLRSRSKNTVGSYIRKFGLARNSAKTGQCSSLTRKLLFYDFVRSQGICKKKKKKISLVWE